MGFQLGLDTGGTYTDAVLLDSDQNIVASAKSLTTHTQLIDGLRCAVKQVLTTHRSPVTLVSLSTTLATNALVEGRGRPVCLILIGYSPGQLHRANLAEALAGDHYGLIAGGHSASGQATTELDRESLSQLVNSANATVEAFAVSALFSVRNPAHEIEARELIVKLTGKPVSLGHTLSSALDAPRRALTALLNARLIPLISSLLRASQKLLDEFGITAPLMVVKGDGSLVSAAIARQSPVETILSGPAASVVGAQFLTTHNDVLIADMGGTTTDIAMIRDRQPKLNPEGATVGGWRTMVQAIDVRTFGLGGDSSVLYSRELCEFSVGPERVLPLCLLTEQYPDLCAELQKQLAMPYSNTWCAQFVIPVQTQPRGLTTQQQELWSLIRSGPIALQTLFADQSLERALNRLLQRGVVLRAGFTPSDACHIVGDQRSWSGNGAVLGAQLLMRYAEQNLGNAYADVAHFARHIKHLVSRNAALAMLETVAVGDCELAGGERNGLSYSQKKLIESTFLTDKSSILQMHASLQLPIVGLGAPAASYYPQTAKWLHTQAIVPAHADVANALGAVVGSVRQQQFVLITAASGTEVNVHFADSVKLFDSLEEAAPVAIEWARHEAVARAKAAGAGNIVVEHKREDNVVENSGERVFFECRIVATAVGRPAVTI